MTDRPDEHGKGERLAARLGRLREAFRNVPAAFRLVWRADRRTTLGMAGLTAVSASLPALQAWVAKLIVDAVLGATREGLAPAAGVRRVLPYLAAEFALLLASALASQLRRLAEEILDHRLGHSINTQIIEKALALPLPFFEDPDFYDRMQNARRQSEYRAMQVVGGGFLLAQSVATLLSFLAILLAFQPIVALVLFGATLPSFIVQSKYSRLNFRLQTWRAPETRRMSYLEHLLTVDGSAKEVKLFDLGPTLLARYDAIFRKTFDEDRALAWRRSRAAFAWGTLSTLTYYGAYAWIVGLTVAGRITLGDMTLYMAIFRQSQAAFEGLFANLARLFENGLFLENLFSFLALRTDGGQPPASVAAEPAAPAGPGVIELRGVSFRYPGKADGAWVLRGIDLRIAGGEKLAIVGENGAGKTTLVKLLTRLYEPTEGRILLDGRDLRDYPPEELHRRIGVIFQDFVRYQLTLRENVGFGSVAHAEDAERVGRAAARGGADEVARGLAAGLETTLGQWFKGGQELSGGQWQKVALSRAFMRDGEVLILDEPTAALDAAREYEIFQRFRELTAGKTAILISHRFSTVRMADRIAVLAGGRIAELGGHAELVARGGRYARLFEMQAEGYR
jgi:ATP-binding cassette subfamily B protein